MIPKIIHQTWGTRDLNNSLLSYTRTWQQKNPDHEYRFYDDDDCAFVVQKYGAKSFLAYGQLNNGAERADLFRYIALYLYGGIYADVDTSCILSIDEWLLPDDQLVVGLEAEIEDDNERIRVEFARLNQYCNWTFAVKPKHPTLHKVIEQVIFNTLELPHLHTLEKTGPGPWTDAVLATPQNQIRRLGRKAFGINSLGWRPSNYQDVYVEHHFLGSWKT